MQTATIIDDIIEDLAALSSKEYLNSIKEAREDYKRGRVKRLEEITDTSL